MSIRNFGEKSMDELVVKMSEKGYMESDEKEEGLEDAEDAEEADEADEADDSLEEE